MSLRLANKIGNKLIKIIHSQLVRSELCSDKNYILQSVEDGFAQKRNDVQDPLIFERIIRSYNKAKAVQFDSPGFYQVSNEWLPIFEVYLGEVMATLKNGNVDRLKSIYNNFFRDPCSVGLHGLPLDMFKCFFSGHISDRHKKLFLTDVLYRHRLWKNLVGPSFGIESLESPLRGNPYGYYIGRTFIKAGSEYQHYYAILIEKLVRGDCHKTVVELGAGYGGMAYYLVRDNSDLTYIDFDLPENVALTAFYLLTCFPDKKIALFGEMDLSQDKVEDYDLILMPNFEIHKVKDQSVDLTFNSYSLAEMSKETIENYIHHFNRFTNKFIFHVNHNRNSVVRADEFSIDLDKFDLIVRAPALWNLAA